MRKSYVKEGIILGSFLLVATPTLFSFNIGIQLPVWVGEIIGDSLSYLTGALIGGIIGFLIKRK